MNKEKWDYDKFISVYNELAMNSGGWMYEEKRSKQEFAAALIKLSLLTLKNKFF